MKTFVLVWSIFTCLCVVVSAQEDAAACAALLRTVLISTRLECDGLGGDQVCYGSSGLSAELVAGDSDHDLAIPGQRVEAAAVVSLQSAPVNIGEGEWGVASIRIRAEVGIQDAALVAFGDFTLENLNPGMAIVEARVTNSTGALARALPDASADLIAPLAFGETIRLVGRLEDSSWLRLQLPDARAAWVSSALVTPLAGESFSDLEVINPDEAARDVYRPLQAFTLRAGRDDAPCAGTPESGLLLQTAEGSPLRLLVNGFIIAAEGTLFLQAENESTLDIYALNGRAVATLPDGGRVTVTAGNGFSLAGDESAPESQPYDYTRVEALPLELLPRSVLIAADWERILIPAAPDPLAGLDSTSACTVAVVSDVNVRTGPGRAYPTRGSMLANQSARPDGRAAGTDGRLWWRLTPGAWLSSDVVFAVGACHEVPLLDVLPRLP